jgi:hypothetical protein
VSAVSSQKKRPNPGLKAVKETSSHLAKLIGDFGSATEATRIIDLGALQVLAKNSGCCNFRLLQQYWHVSDMPRQPDDVR